MSPSPRLPLLFPFLLLAGYPVRHLVRADSPSACPSVNAGIPSEPHVSEIASLPAERYSVTGGETRVLAGHVAHGMKDMEVLFVQLKKGEQTPIISHPQEKVLITVKGSGSLFILNGSGPTQHTLGDNSTATVHPGTVHQILGSESQGLELLIAIAEPPVRTVEYGAWDEALLKLKNNDDDSKAQDAPWNKCLSEETVELRSQVTEHTVRVDNDEL